MFVHLSHALVPNFEPPGKPGTRFILPLHIVAETTDQLAKLASSQASPPLRSVVLITDNVKGTENIDHLNKAGCLRLPIAYSKLVATLTH